MNDIEPVNCTLCGRVITGYDARFHHLHIDETHGADICRSCLDRIIRWQRETYTALFPTAASKRLIEKRRRQP